MSSRALATTITSSYFCGWKINLSGISPAKRSRFWPNSICAHVNANNVQGILGAIAPFWAKWGLGQVPRSGSFFCVVIQRTFWQLRNSRLLPNLVTKHSSVSRRGIHKDILKIFTLGDICSENLKSKIGQTGTSLRAGYRSSDRCIAERYCLLHVVVQRPGSFTILRTNVLSYQISSHLPSPKSPQNLILVDLLMRNVLYREPSVSHMLMERLIWTKDGSKRVIPSNDVFFAGVNAVPLNSF